jgi:hypothetical protein
MPLDRRDAGNSSLTLEVFWKRADSAIVGMKQARKCVKRRPTTPQLKGTKPNYAEANNGIRL